MIDIQCRCGEVYHADEAHAGKAIRCLRCGNRLNIPVSRSETAQRDPREEPSHNEEQTTGAGPISREYGASSIDRRYARPQNATPAPGPASKSRVSTWLVVCCLLILVGVSWILGGNRESSAPAERAQPTTYVRPTDHVLPNGYDMWGRGHSGLGELVVDNGTSYDAVAKLVDAETMRTSRMMFVQRGRVATMQHIGQGTYILRYALGLNWQTSNRTFERHAQYAEFDEFLEYVQSSRGGYWSYEITLHKVPGGDARTTDIDEQEFLRSDGEPLPPMPEAYGDEWHRYSRF